MRKLIRMSVMVALLNCLLNTGCKKEDVLNKEASNDDVLNKEAAISSNAARLYVKPDFPRLAGINSGNPHNYHDASYQNQLARLHLSIWGAWPGMAPGGIPLNTHIASVKAKNPNILIFLYVVSNEIHKENSATSAWREYKAKLDRMKWYLYPFRTMGEPVISTFGNDYHIINNTTFTAKDSAGLNALDWQTHYFVNKIAKPNSNADGLFMDNVFWKPRVTGDWNLDGITDDKDKAEAGKWLRLGYQRYFTLVKSLMPGKIQIGNVADWGEEKAILTELNGYVQGGVLEGMIGTNYSPEGWGSWKLMMSHYRKTMAAFGEPKLGIFHQQGLPTDYQAFRYGFASCLLDDAYYSFTASVAGYSGVVWFDEYDVRLGKALSGPSLTPWKDGIYRRDFEKGIVLVNPRGNGNRTITIEPGFKRFLGKQDPVTNNGAEARTITLKDRDGLVLIKKAP